MLGRVFIALLQVNGLWRWAGRVGGECLVFCDDDMNLFGVVTDNYRYVLFARVVMRQLITITLPAQVLKQIPITW